MQRSGRELALEVLLGWRGIGDPPRVPEREGGGADGWEDAAPRERGFAFDLIHGVIRWRGCLDAVISSRLTRPLESLDHPLRVILWIGAYQLLMQGGTAAYAAVDTAVEMARGHRATANGAGLVNAVLRGITRLSPRVRGREKRLSRRAFALDFEKEVAFSADVFADPARDLDVHLAAARSHPRILAEFLRRTFGGEMAGELMLRNNLRPALICRVDGELETLPAAAGLMGHGEKGYAVAGSGWNEALAGLVKSGKISPQDPTAGKAVRVIAEMVRPRRVLDLCAGLGTKTIQAARAFPDAQITAADVDEGKLRRLAARVKEAGIENVRPCTASELSKSGGVGGAGGRFDLVLADVPCSNTGVMGRRVQSRWRWPSLDHAGLHALQGRLLKQGAELLELGGVLVYSTCSIDPAENEQVIAAFLAGSGMRLAREEKVPPSLGAEAPHDGGYVAVLGR